MVVNKREDLINEKAPDSLAGANMDEELVGPNYDAELQTLWADVQYFI